jgi:hypothetical protein
VDKWGASNLIVLGFEPGTSASVARNSHHKKTDTQETFACLKYCSFTFPSIIIFTEALLLTHEVEVTLRLTVDQSVCLGVGHPFGAHNQILLFFFVGKLLCSSSWGALSDEKTGL